MKQFLYLICFFYTGILAAQGEQLVRKVTGLYPVENAEQFVVLGSAVKQLLTPGGDEITWPPPFHKTLKSAQDWASRHGTFRQKLLADYYLLMFYNNNLADGKAIPLGKKLLQEPEFLELPESAFALAAMNSSYRRKGYYQQQLAVLEKLIVLNKKFGYIIWPETYAYYNEMGLIYYRLGQYGPARSNFRKQAELFRENGALFRTSSTINNIGLTFEHQQQPDSALVYYKKALELIENKNIKDDYYSGEYIAHFQNVIRSNIAENRMNRGVYDQAEAIFKQELASSKSVKEFSTAAFTYQKLSRLYYLTGRYQLAGIYNDSTLYFEKKFRNPANRQKALQLKVKILLKEQKSDSALIFTELANKLRDSLIRDEKHKNYSEAASKFNFIQSEEALKVNRELLEQKEKNSRLQWFITGIIICILVLMIWLFYKTKKSNRIITSQKKALTKGLKEKEIMLDEIQHRIKNNLQVISGILEFQKHKTETTEAEVLQESQEYLQSMFMIHELLYEQEKGLDMLDIQVYFEKMADFMINNYPGLKVNWDIHARISLNVKTATPLGLMVCELMMNSLKHAFTETGEIGITVTRFGENYRLLYADNGKGYEKKADSLSYGTGMNLIFMLAEDLSGEINFPNSDGFSLQLDFEAS
ncbi:tetratricopeptide repeat-containing sensor histidine kinase [Sinomicrobium weinanense]|uniref:histidine kinase n=1 Tax=Sinomicrobium weinanense TaxID=2842200 RepID=A0A926JUY2_9FLAO|nr:histidine kinase dimerization/phosphoacceptor domain -containing protein [Sinomicrobium weinanense]MBC9797945.1 tetratricopeptide repeat protein [Sinomicrobium weinanense]MBU3123263.1 tetratricopeptide repeat protein [Sinomicrobium weinanense]